MTHFTRSGQHYSSPRKVCSGADLPIERDAAERRFRVGLTSSSERGPMTGSGRSGPSAHRPQNEGRGLGCSRRLPKPARSPWLPRGYSFRLPPEFTRFPGNPQECIIASHLAITGKRAIACTSMDSCGMQPTLKTPQCRACQGRGRGFESHRPLQIAKIGGPSGSARR